MEMENFAMRVIKKISRKYFLRCMREYCQITLGHAEKNGISIFVTCCRALHVEGRKRPSGVTFEEWCWYNSEYIVSRSGLAAKDKEAKAPDGKPKRKKNKSVAANAFLSSYEWRKLRMEALKKYGTKCQCCGASPSTGAVINVDHIKPRKLFPELALELSNLQILCEACNHGKGNWDQTDWRENLLASKDQ